MTGLHGSIRLIEPACTSCMICARQCPAWCISIDSHTEPIPDLPPGVRERTRHELDRFAIDWSLCMYCGICIDECPFDALEWVTSPTAAGIDLIEEMVAPPQPHPPSASGAGTPRQDELTRSPRT